MRTILKLILLISLVLTLLAGLLFAGAVFGYRYYILTPRDPERREVLVFDTAGAVNFRDIARQLEERGVIRSAVALRALARLEHTDTQIKAGEYALSPSMTVREVLDMMVRGETIPRRATIREGMSLIEIARVLDEAGIVGRDLFNAALIDRTVLDAEGLIEVSSFEGYLFPETYNFRAKSDPKSVIRAMHEQLKQRWGAEFDERASALGMSRHQVLTLASIVEKESGNFDEQPIVASVFHNRLRLRMRLQSDPTVIYGIVDFNGDITKRDLQRATPYNTYVIDGLPPGPIASPGLSAIKAVLYPAETSYLYFVGNGAGRHVFSEDLERHNLAVNRYQRGGGGAGGGGM